MAKKKKKEQQQLTALEMIVAAFIEHYGIEKWDALSEQEQQQAVIAIAATTYKHLKNKGGDAKDE